MTVLFQAILRIACLSALSRRATLALMLASIALGTALLLGVERIRVRGANARATWKTIDILACPVTFSPHPQQIEAARRGYDDWWQALGGVREGLIAGGMLREVEVTVTMPKARPWRVR